ncbi:cytochrome P450 [Delitschia confertaspora ATCC 74209]|uniref:Cytochrome P450 n=1 Tax=Delitschia confertaspora ATCC 74209 TaxID=1513339 RepID=A0A9P4JFD2_9PLEO|nr:cytochrome P450 [Delitschia confertaspora ATCC 74209]
MAPLLLIFLSVLTVLFHRQWRRLQNNISEAKATGLPYVVVPFFFATVKWVLVRPLMLPLFKLLPDPWAERWPMLLEFTRGWHNGYKPFELEGCDTFVAVSPDRNVVYTCDPDVSAHFLRGPSFGKPQELLGILNIFGPTMTGTDGAEARLYRKTTAPFFTERTMKQVWTESTKGAKVLLNVFADSHPDRTAFSTSQMRAVISRLTLHILNSVCFEKRIDDEALRKLLKGEERAPEGHVLTYSQAMHGVLDYFDVIFFTPRAILNHSPLKVHRKARQAFYELRKYIEDLRSIKEKEMQPRKEVKKDSESLLDLLVLAGMSSPTPTLCPKAVIGNIFIFMFAGHEANANTLTFLLLLLACNPGIQKATQEDIDRILFRLRNEGRTDSSLSSLYEQAFPALIEGYVGACINEALRLFTVIPFLVKTVPQSQDAAKGEDEGHTFSVAGNMCRIPGGSMVLINTTAVHRHPQYWPDCGTTSRNNIASGKTNPVDSFDPQRWLVTETSASTKDKVPEGARFLRPKAGSFMPFSDGGRGCLGKRFALVELCAIVTQILSEYTIELVVKGDQDWQKTRENAARTLTEEVAMDMSLRLTAPVPVRFVKR